MTKKTTLNINQLLVILFLRININLNSHLSHQLSVYFGNSVDGARSLHTQVRCRVAGGSGTEGANGAGDKQSQAVLCCNVQDVVKP